MRLTLEISRIQTHVPSYVFTVAEEGMLYNEHSNFRYAGLYFCICVDVSDNNLYYLEVKATKLDRLRKSLNICHP